MTPLPTFDRKSENNELFEHLFQTSLELHNQLTEENKIEYFHFSYIVTHCRRSKTSAAETERIWQKP